MYHQSPITNHQSPITNHQSPITNHSLSQNEIKVKLKCVPMAVIKPIIFYPPFQGQSTLCFKYIINLLFTIVLFFSPLAFSSDSQDWLDDYQKNGGVFKPETHTVYPNRVMQPSGFVVATTEMLYKIVGSTRKPLDWTDIQPKLVNQNTPQSEAMAAYKEYAHFAGNFMIFHLFAVPKVLVGFSDEDRAMISSKWGIETHHIPKDGDYVELIYSTENRWGGSSPSHHKITVNHKKIAELGSLNAYLKHKGFTFTPSGVEFTFENNKIDFNSRRDKIEIFNYIFNFLSNDYTYRLGNQASASANFKSDWKRIYNYSLGKHSPQFARSTVLAGHKNYKNALSELSKVHKFSFSKDGGVGGADIDGESFYVLEDILIPKSALDWNNAQVTLNRGATYYKQERKWVGLTRKYFKGEVMSGDEVFMYLKARLNGFKDLSNGASSGNIKENPIHKLPTKTYTFTFTKSGGLGGSNLNNKFYVDINGLFVPHSDIKETKPNTYELSIPDNGIYYRAKHSQSEGFIRGEKLTAAHAYNYLKANVTTDPGAHPYLYKQQAGANPNIPGMPPVKSGSQQKTEDCSVNIAVYKFAFDGIVHEYFKPIIVNSEKFYILSNILIPSSSWGWNGKITVTINKAATYHKSKFELFNNYQDRRIVKGQAMSGGEVFNSLKGALSSKGFEDNSCETSNQNPSQKVAAPPKPVQQSPSQKVVAPPKPVQQSPSQKVATPPKPVQQSPSQKVVAPPKPVQQSPSQKVVAPPPKPVQSPSQQVAVPQPIQSSNLQGPAVFGSGGGGSQKSSPGSNRSPGSQGSSVGDRSSQTDTTDVKKESNCKKDTSVYKFAFTDNYKEFHKAITIDEEQFYISGDILIPIKNWGVDGSKIILTIKKTDIFNLVETKMVFDGGNEQALRYIKGKEVSGEEVFHWFQNHFALFDFEDRNNCETRSLAEAPTATPTDETSTAATPTDKPDLSDSRKNQGSSVIQ